MTTKQTPALQKAWEEYKKRLAEGDRLYEEGEKLSMEGRKLQAEGDRLSAEGTTYWAQANRLWKEAVKDVYGNMAYEWRNWNKELQSLECRLANGEVYAFPPEEGESV